MATADTCSDATPTDAVDDVRTEIRRTKRCELAEATRKLKRDGLTEEQRRIVAALADAITTEVTADAVEALQTAADRGDVETVAIGRSLLSRDGRSDEGQL
ncbi:hypothetical protein [Halomicrococcus sp. NG-SE-24]|uniref:hypothetical protein n=1 Tax=Halomicrococcus sp. NG-SE-24 TaxID=3436928 RepID=UPI003D95CF81